MCARCFWRVRHLSLAVAYYRLTDRPDRREADAIRVTTEGRVSASTTVVYNLRRMLRVVDVLAHVAVDLEESLPPEPRRVRQAPAGQRWWSQKRRNGRCCTCSSPTAGRSTRSAFAASASR